MTTTLRGRDTWCEDDLWPGRVVSETECVRQAIWRRLRNRRGSVIDAPGYGLDLMAYHHRGLTDAQRARLAALVAAECRRDTRVANATCTATLTGTSLTVSARVMLRDGTSFPLVMTVGELVESRNAT